MEKNNMLGLAISIAAEAFRDKTDKAGKPYILHCLRVMNNMQYIDPNDEELMCIAVLHDVPEDTDISVQDLRKIGFSDRVCIALDLLTHAGTEGYDTYIKMLSFNADAVRVKLSDLFDNSNIARMKGLRKKDLDRLEKYHRAFHYLSN